MESSIQIIIICCDEERRKFQKKQMEDLNLPYVFFNGYTPNTMGDYITDKNSTHPEPDTVISCFRSHVGALKMFVDKFPEKEYVLIVEDDSVIINNFVEELNKILIKFKSNKNIDYITLGIGLNHFEKPESTFSDENLVWGNMIVWGAILQLIPMSIAKEMVQLLDKPNTTLLYIDVLKKKHAMPNCMGYTKKNMRLQADVVFSILWRQGCVWPPMAIENDKFNSLITPLDNNNRWQHIFDLNIRKKEEFYNFSLKDKVQIIIICCNEERRKFQKKQMEDLNIPYVFFNGYTPNTMGDFITEKHKEYPEVDTMICCTRSHIGAIDLFVKQYQDKEYCIIMEDDVIVINTFMDEVQKIIRLWDSLAAPNPIDLISLGYLPFEKNKECLSNGVLHWGTEDGIWGTQCYMINRKCAIDMAATLVQKNTTDLFSILKNKKNYANKVLRIQPDVIITGYWKQGFIWPQIAIEKGEFNSIITPEDKNSDRHMFDFKLRKREEFYKPFSMNNVQIIIISCNEERRKFQQKQMEDLNLSYAFYDAYTPKTMGDYITEKNKEIPEADTTLCCMRSHIDALKMFVENFPEKEYVIIAEDDILLINDFKKELEATMKQFKNHKEIDYISLGCSPEQKDKYKSAHNDRNLFWGNMIAWSTTLQIIPISIAKDMVNLLDVNNTAELYAKVYTQMSKINNGLGYAFKQVRLQSDSIFSILWYQACVWPPMAIENENFNSVITPKITNNRWQHIFDLNIRKREEFYTPINLLIKPYVINLQHRKDRWQEVQEEFKKLDLIPIRIDAVYNKNGALGCMASHIKTLTEGLQSNQPIWVCEDDSEILVSKLVLFSIINEFLKSDGDILCLGNNLIRKTTYNATFDKALETQTTSSYVIKPSFAIILRNHWQEMEEYISKGKTHFSEVLFRQTDMYGKNAYHNIDINWKILQQYFKFLVPKIKCIKQRESYSDIENKIVNYNV